LPATPPDGAADPGLVTRGDKEDGAIAAFIAALGKHRIPERETDPPVV